MNYQNIPLTHASLEDVEEILKQVEDPETALAWAQTKASLQLFIRLNGGRE